MHVKTRSLSPGRSIPALEMTSQSHFWICAYRTPIKDSYHPLENSCMAPGPLTATDMAATIDIMVAQHSIALWAIVFDTPCTLDQS